MFQEYVASCLLWIDSNAVLCDDGCCVRVDFELFGCELHNSCEWDVSQNAEATRTKRGNACNQSHFDLEKIPLWHTFTYTLKGSFGSDVSVTLNLTFASSSLILNWNW